MKKRIQNNLNVLTFQNMPQTSMCHFSTLRQGGVSQGNYASLNLGNLSDDNPSDVIENRRILSEAFGIRPQALFIPHQTHSDHIRVIDRTFLSLPQDRQKELLNDTDAIITDQKNIGIGITTADCVPILLYDIQKHVLAAIHAGWKGTVACISQKTVEQMTRQFGCDPKNILAGIGPSISADHFEVGDEVGKAFIDAGFPLDDMSFRNTKTGKLHIDLWAANKYLLMACNIPDANIEIAGLCTYSDTDNFFSARRQTVHSGRMLTGGIIIEQ